jgi:broad specificity phosphatase PhoE
LHFAFVSSPLSRANETLEIMHGALGEPRLAEPSFGPQRTRGLICRIHRRPRIFAIASRRRA